MTNYAELEEESQKLVLNHSSDRYRYVIYESIYNYNYRAQLDLARAVFELYRAATDRYIQINLLNRMVSLHLELFDQLYLIIVLAETGDWKKYVKGSNRKEVDFYNECAEGLSENRLFKVYGINHDHLRSSAREGIQAMKVNLQQIGLNYNRSTNIIQGSYSIKHGYKTLYKTPESDKLFAFDNSDYTIIADIGEIKNIPHGKTTVSKSIITTGLLCKKEEEIKTLSKTLDNMRIESEQIKEIAKCQLMKLEDEFFYLRKEIGIVKIKPNDLCPCKKTINPNTGNYLKYKLCHGNIS